MIRERGISQRTIARICGKSDTIVSRWCAGRLRPDPASLAILSTFLGVPAGDLVRPIRIGGEDD